MEPQSGIEPANMACPEPAEPSSLISVIWLEPRSYPGAA